MPSQSPTVTLFSPKLSDWAQNVEFRIGRRRTIDSVGAAMFKSPGASTSMHLKVSRNRNTLVTKTRSYRLRLGNNYGIGSLWLAQDGMMSQSSCLAAQPLGAGLLILTVHVLLGQLGL